MADTTDTFEDVTQADRDVGEQSVGKKKFRMNNQYFMLTYKRHLPKVEYTRWFKELTGGAEWMRLAHETGDDNCPYNHTHVLVNMGKPWQTRDCRKFDYVSPDIEDITYTFVGSDIKEEYGILHPHIKTYKTKWVFKKIQRYIGKEDPDNKDLLSIKDNWVEAVAECEDTIEALTKYADTPAMATGVIATHKLVKKIAPISKHQREGIDFNVVTELRGWQKDLENILTGPISRRDIYWIYDERGCRGKRVFGEWMETKYPKEFWFVDNLTCIRNAATIIQNHLYSGEWSQGGMIINLVRQQDRGEAIYTTYEAIKDCKINTVKGMNSGPIKGLVPCHLMITANFLPHVEHMSDDRWIIYEIKDVVQDGITEERLVKISVDEVKRRRNVSAGVDISHLLGDIDLKNIKCIEIGK